MKNIMLLDKNKESLGFITYINDEFYMDLTTGAETFTVTVLDNKVVELGGYLVFKYGGKIKIFEIKTITQSWEGIKIYSEWNGIKLSNNVMRPFKLTSNIDGLLSRLLFDTSYEKGYISPTLETNLQTVSVTENTSVYKILQNLVDIYSCELEFDVKEDNGEYKYILNVYGSGERGAKKYKRFIDGETIKIDSIEKDTSERVSGLICSGKDGVNIQDIEDLEEDGIVHKLNNDFIIDTNTKNEIGLIFGNYVSQSDNPRVIVEEGFKKLAELRDIKTTYNCKSVIVDEEISIGDTIYIISKNFTNKIAVSCRVSTLKISFSNPSKNEATFQDFVEIRSALRDGATVIQDSVRDAEELINGSLSPMDKLALKDYLAQLGVHESDIEDLFNKAEENTKEDIDFSQDGNYKPVYVTDILGGLYIGDKVGKLKEGSNIVVDETTPTTTTSTTLISYNDAIRYYNTINWQDSKGKDYFISSRNGAIKDLTSSSNKNKISIIVNNIASTDKLGVDPYILYALIAYNSGGDIDHEWTLNNIKRYGLMGIPESFFGVKCVIKLGNGKDGSFIPSLSTLNPAKGKSLTVSGVSGCNQNIYNQIKMGAWVFKECLKNLNYNIFAGILAYFYTVNDVMTMVGNYIQNTSKASILAELGKYRADWCDDNHKELLVRVLSYYYINNKQLPYALDSNNAKIGLGVSAGLINPPSAPVVVVPDTTVPVTPSTNDTRTKILEMANKILNLCKNGKAWYSMSYRTVNYNNLKKILSAKESSYLKKHIGEYGWDCSSLTETCYRYAGVTGFTGLSCSGHSIQDKAKSMGCECWTWASDKDLSKLKPGDLVMFAGTNSSSKDVSGFSKTQLLSYNTPTHHVAIYAGNGYIIHARTYSKGICKTNYSLGNSAFFIRLNKLDS